MKLQSPKVAVLSGKAHKTFLMGGFGYVWKLLIVVDTFGALIGYTEKTYSHLHSSSGPLLRVLNLLYEM